MNLCRSCRQDFGSVSAFDRHRVGRHAYTLSEGLELGREDGRRCLDVDEMQATGMALDARGRWTITRDVERARTLRISAETPSGGRA